MKTISGRTSISLSCSAFTLIELFVAVSITGILAAIALPVLASVQKKSRAVTETNSARQIVTAYLAYAVDHDGELMPGNLPGATVSFPNGDTGGGPEAERYPWRLASYLQWNADIYMINDLTKTVQSMDRQAAEYRYMVSLAPALGMNTYLVGGHFTASTLLAPNDVVTRLGQIEQPLVVFVSARIKTVSKSGPQSGDLAGSHFVQAPILAKKWKAGAFDAKKASSDFGNVDFRHDDRAVTAFSDGAVRMMTVEELRDMRLWARHADTATYGVSLQ